MVRRRPVLRKATAGLVAGGVAWSLVAAPAAAGTVQIIGAQTQLIFGQTNVWPSGHVQMITDTQNQESHITPIVCNTQGAVSTTYPGSSDRQFLVESQYNGGCAWTRAYGYTAYEGIFDPIGTGYNHKWKSNATGGNWTDIGTVYS